MKHRPQGEDRDPLEALVERRTAPADEQEARADRAQLRFDQQLRRWASKEPQTPPALAAERIVDRLRPRPPRGAKVALGLAALLLIALALGLWRRQLQVTPDPRGLDFPSIGTTSGQDLAAIGEPEQTTPVLDEGVVLLWLDAETPLYWTVKPPAPDHPVSKEPTT